MDLTAFIVYIDYITQLLSKYFAMILSYLGIETTTTAADTGDTEETE
ncbi:MAG: hypothetical protein LUG85_08020 [Clostridiales bacterium]|nr:hypothetical protein [Clostridiales bacterium]MCD7828463.1 hypothetical protein [Clostridiales bacterium]